MKNYYKILEVNRTATADDIKKSFRRLAMLYHPDKNKEAGAEDKFKEIQEAYSVLSDPEAKKRYDNNSNPHLHGKSTRTGGYSYKGFSESDVNDFINKHWAGFDRTSGFNMRNGFGMVKDVHINYEIELNAALAGHNGEVSYIRSAVCPECQDTKTVKCKYCNGLGYDFNTEGACPHCGGKGRITCDKCKNMEELKKRVRQPIRISIREQYNPLTYGEDGNLYMNMKFPGAGNRMVDRLLNKLASSDLYVKVKIVMPSDIIINGNNIIHNLYYRIGEVTFQREFMLTTVDGRKFNVKLKSFKYLNDIRATIPQIGIMGEGGAMGSYVFKFNILAPDIESISEEERDVIKKSLDKL